MSYKDVKFITKDGKRYVNVGEYDLMDIFYAIANYKYEEWKRGERELSEDEWRSIIELDDVKKQKHYWNINDWFCFYEEKRRISNKLLC